MTFQLITGLLQQDPGWEMLLSQIGVPYESIDNDVPSPAQKYGVIIINDSPDEQDEAFLKNFLENGGAILDNGYYASPSSMSKVYIKNIFPEAEDPLFGHLGPIDLYETAHTYQQAERFRETLHFDASTGNLKVFLGWNISKLMRDTRSERKIFYSPTGHRPEEEVSKISKGAVREVVTRILVWLYTKRQLPFVHLWPMPEDHTSLFCFRVDSDFSAKDDIKTLYKLGCNYDLSMSWFLHVEAHRDWLSHFKTMEEQELALHGYHHQTYLSYANNYVNIQEGLQELGNHDITPEGFCAPYGKWNRKLQRAIDEFDFHYSSEFALDYDNFPFHPYYENKVSHVLQIPIHPIGIGRLQNAGAETEAIIQYFNYLIEWKKNRLEPIILYHHPKQHNRKVLESLFEEIHNQHIPNITFLDYAQWWKEREKISLTPRYDKSSDTLLIDSSQTSDQHWLGIFTDESTFALSRLNSQIKLEDLSKRTYAPHRTASVKALKELRTKDFTLLKHSILDWIHRLKS